MEAQRANFIGIKPTHSMPELRGYAHHFRFWPDSDFPLRPLFRRS